MPVVLAVVLAPRAQALEVAQETAPVSAEAQTVESFPIPEGLQTAVQHFEFVEQLYEKNKAELENNLEGEDEAKARKEFEIKMAQTVLSVFDRLEKVKLSEDEAAQAHFFRLQAARELAQKQAPGGSRELKKAIEAARKYPASNVQAVGIKFFIEGNFQSWPNLDKTEKQEMLEEVKKFLVEGEPDPYRVNTLLSIHTFLQQMHDEPLIKPLMAAMLPRFEKSEDERIRQIGVKLSGTLRRLKLPGNKMELSGSLLDGRKLDWESYRGKVVLVDFWATWCGPCRQEVPNVLRLYKQYHDQGFEVVGVSLDAEKEQAESYIEQYDLPWPNIFSPNKDERAWDAPMAVHYGVMGIPLAILVDAEGKVLSLEARGPKLAILLEDIFGKK